MNKEKIIIILTSILLVSISIYNYLVYIDLGQAKKQYKNVSVFENNCNLNSQQVNVGTWSNLLTMILSIFLLVIIAIFIIRNK